MLSQVKRHSMQISLFLFICVIATFAIIEATPWYRQAKPQRYEETDFHGSSNGLKSEQYVSNVMDPDAELITITNSDGGYNNGAVPQNGGGNREFQGGEEQEQGGAEDDENGYRGRRKYITRYGKHNDRRMKNGYSDEDDSSDSTNRDGGYNNGAVSQNGASYLGNREFQGGEEQGVAEDLYENGYKSRRVYTTRYGQHNNRRMKNRYSDKDDSNDSDDSEDDDESSKKGCRGCYNNIGNGRKNYNRVYINWQKPHRDDNNNAPTERYGGSNDEITETGSLQQANKDGVSFQYRNGNDQGGTYQAEDDYQDSNEYQSRRGYGGRGRYRNRGVYQIGGRGASRFQQDDDNGDIASEEYQYTPRPCTRGCRVNNIGNGQGNRNEVYMYH